MYAMIALGLAGHRVTWIATGGSCSAVPYGNKMIREEKAVLWRFRGDLEEGMKKSAIRSA